MIAEIQARKAAELRALQMSHAQELQQQTVALAEDKKRLAPLAQQHSHNLRLIEANLNVLNRQMPSLAANLFYTASMRGNPQRHQPIPAILAGCHGYPKLTSVLLVSSYNVVVTLKSGQISVYDRAKLGESEQMVSGTEGILNGPLAELVLPDEYLGNKAFRSWLYTFRVECFQTAEQLLDDTKLAQIIAKRLDYMDER